MEKTVKISNLRKKSEFKMEKRVKISILVIKREFEMEKTVKISILRRKRELKMEKRVKISILGRKKEFKMEKTVKISILGRKKRVQNGKNSQNFHFEIRIQVPLAPTISYNRKPPIWTRVIQKSRFPRNWLCWIISNCIREVV